MSVEKWKPYGFRVEEEEFENSFEHLLLSTFHVDIASVPSIPVPVPVNYFPRKMGVVSDLTVEEVRWFYKDSEGKWMPFRGKDSILLEQEWRKGTDVVAQENCCQERELPVVLDGFYVLNDQEINTIKPIYWSGDSIQITRGTWFTTAETPWQPLDMCSGDAIEKEHLRCFRGQKIPEKPLFFDDKAIRPILSEIKLKEKDTSVVWNSVIDVIMTQPTTFFRKTEVKLHRGYQNEASLLDAPLPIKHLVFVTHGIGQKFQAGQIVKQTTEMRDVIKDIIDKYYQHVHERIMWLPVEWRSDLKLDDGTMELITPPHIEMLRELLNATAMDIMYYTSPLYRTEITNSLMSELNRLYREFLYYNPTFLQSGGKVSILAHSLGSVIVYDIIERWSPLQLYDHYINEQIEGSLESCQDPDIKELLSNFEDMRKQILDRAGGIHNVLQKGPVLDFRVHNLFLIGSPLGVFLAMRGYNRGADIFSLGQCENLFNIYHPNDPVAYRIEPLLSKPYANVQPVSISRVDKAEKTVYNFQELTMYDSKKKLEKQIPVASEVIPCSSNCSEPDLKKVEVGLLKSEVGLLKSENEDKPIKPWKTSAIWARFRSQKHDSSETINSDSEAESSVKSVDDIPEENRLKRRTDFCIKPGLLESTYVSAIYSHITYWTNHDVLMFILMQLFPTRGDSKSVFY